MKKSIKFIIFLLIFSLIGTSLALLFSNHNKSYELEVAKPIIVIDGPTSFNINDDSEYILDNENTITVTNKKNNKINEVAMNYWLEFVSDELDINKVDIELKRNDTEVSILNGVSESFILRNNVFQTDVFKIKIKYNSVENYSGTIHIYIKAQQIQPE